MTVATSAPPQPPAPAPGVARILGRLLMEDARLAPEALEAALAAQAVTGERLGAVLVRQGAVDADAVARALARQLGLPYQGSPLEPDASVGGLLPEAMARRARVVPLTSSARALRLAMEDPLDVAAAEDVRFRTGRRVEVVVAAPTAVAEGLDRLYGGEVDRIAAGLAGDEDTEDEARLERAARAAPVVRLVDRVLHEAVSAGASDVHVEPAGAELVVRLRVDGVMREAHRLPGGVRAAVLSRLKIMGGLDIAVRRRPQDGGLVLRHERGELPLRLSTLPARGGEKAVLRVLDPGRAPGGLDELGLATADCERLRRLLAAGQGVVLAAGPTGSGKSSTLQAALREVDRGRLNVVTLEDPVEYRIPGVTHVQVDTRSGLGFPEALRAVLRQDPDVIMIGEIRDRETAEIAMAAAVTGHLVLSTIHTTDAPGAVTRLLHMGVPSYLVAGGLTGVVAQRLVRTVCGACRGRADAGCRKCRDGFTGRTGVFQVLVVDDPLRDAVVTGASGTAVRRAAREAGMGTLADDARRKVAEGITTPFEAGRVLRTDPGAALPCDSCGGGVPSGAPACPACGTVRRPACSCGAALEPGWRYCPFCIRKIGGGGMSTRDPRT